MLKSVILNLLKFALAFGLIYWLVQSGKLDTQLIQRLFANPLFVIAILFGMFCIDLIGTFRWKLILQFNSNVKLKYFKVFRANWIGLFFNSVLPGAVSGDLIKVFYIKDENPAWSKKFLFASVFLDRLLGVFGLVILGAISGLISYTYLSSLSSQVTMLVHFIFLLFSGVIFSFVMVFFFQNLPLKISQIVKSRLHFLAGILDKLEIMWKDLCSFKHNLLIYLLLSTIIQGAALIIFWFVVKPYTNIPFELTHAAIIFPIGIIFIAIPISPAGLGVGHLIFEQLFTLLGFENGANLFNIYIIIYLMHNLTGVIPYVLHSGKRVKISEISEDQI